MKLLTGVLIAAGGAGCADRALDEPPPSFEAKISSGRAYEDVTYGQGRKASSNGVALNVSLLATNHNVTEPLTVAIADAQLAWNGEPDTAQSVALTANSATSIDPSRQALVRFAAILPQMKACGTNPQAPSEQVTKDALSLSLRVRLNNVETSLATHLDFACDYVEIF